MSNQINSRFITYPSTVEKSTNHTVVLIDAVEEDIERIGLFLKTSQQDFDVYLYRGDLYDLEWLNYIGNEADVYLIHDTSQVKVSHDSLRYGPGLDLPNPLSYFQKIEQLVVDNTAEKVV